MKSFKEYLVENKKVYKFKIKVVGDCPKDCTEKIKLALSEYSCASVGTAKTTPISANHKDFPEHKNVAMSVFDTCTHYPATSEQILNKVAQGLGMSPGSVKVLNEKEQEEVALNHAHDDATGESIVGTAYEKADNQDLVGDKRLTFLKSLKNEEKFKQVTGTNDQLLAKTMPKADTKIKTQEATINNIGTFSKKKVNLVPVKHKNSLNVAAKVKGK
jgi:hypothetical protein